MAYVRVINQTPRHDQTTRRPPTNKPCMRACVVVSTCPVRILELLVSIGSEDRVMCTNSLPRTRALARASADQMFSHTDHSAKQELCKRPLRELTKWLTAARAPHHPATRSSDQSSDLRMASAPTRASASASASRCREPQRREHWRREHRRQEPRRSADRRARPASRARPAWSMPTSVQPPRRRARPPDGRVADL